MHDLNGLTQERDQLAAELKKNRGRMVQLEEAFRKSFEAQASAAIQAAGGNPALLLPIAMQDVKIFEENESFIAGIADKQGGKRIRDVKGAAFTIQDLVGEMKSSPAFARAFDGPSKTLAPNTRTRADFDGMTPAEQMAHIKAGGRVVD